MPHIDGPIKDINGLVERYETCGDRYGWMGPSDKVRVRNGQMFRFLEEPTRIFVMRLNGIEEITKSLSDSSYALLVANHYYWTLQEKEPAE